MATIEKRGDSFRIIVSGGYTADGKQIRERMTWTPPEGMSGDKALKEAQKQAALFEDKIRQGRVVDSKMKLETFINEKYLPDYAERYLKRSTRAGYKRIINGIIAALGHMRLCDIRPTHINTFYGNLQEEGMRQKTTATAKGDLTKVREAAAFQSKSWPTSPACPYQSSSLQSAEITSLSRQPRRSQGRWMPKHRSCSISQRTRRRSLTVPYSPIIASSAASCRRPSSGNTSISIHALLTVISKYSWG